MIDEDADDAARPAPSSSADPRAAVESFAAGHEVLHREDLAGVTRDDGARAPTPAPPAQLGLRLEPVSLQQLVVRATARPNQGTATSTREKVDQS